MRSPCEAARRILRTRLRPFSRTFDALDRDARRRDKLSLHGAEPRTRGVLTRRPLVPGVGAMSSRPRARERARRRRRRQARLVLLVVVVVGAIVLALTLGTGHKDKPPRTQSTQDATATPPVRPPAVEAGLLPWQLPASVSREVVVPRTGTHGLLVLGGLDSGASSTSSMDVLDTRNGRLSPNGQLLQPTHDAAVAELGGHVFVIGGGSATPARSIQIARGGTTVSGGALPQRARRRERGDRRSHGVPRRRLRRIGDGCRGRRDDRRAQLPPGRRASGPCSLSGGRCPRLADLRLRRPRSERPSQRARSSSSTRPSARRAWSDACPCRSTGPRPACSAARSTSPAAARRRGRPAPSTHSSRAKPRSCARARCESPPPTPAPR